MMREGYRKTTRMGGLRRHGWGVAAAAPGGRRPLPSRVAPGL